MTQYIVSVITGLYFVLSGETHSVSLRKPQNFVVQGRTLDQWETYVSGIAQDIVRKDDVLCRDWQSNCYVDPHWLWAIHNVFGDLFLYGGDHHKLLPEMGDLAFKAFCLYYQEVYLHGKDKVTCLSVYGAEKHK